MSSLTNPDTPLAVRLNHPVPGFALPDAEGNIVRLVSFKQRRPVLLALLHSGSCPHCRAWLANLAVARDDLGYFGVQPLLILSDDVPSLHGLQKEVGAPGTLLSDPAGATRARYLRTEDAPSQQRLQSVLLIAVGRYNELLAVWDADEPSGWPPLAEPLATFAFAEQEDCACGLPVWPDA